MENLFIQFYSFDETPPKWSWDAERKEYRRDRSHNLLLNNGFSEVFNICNQMGKMEWVEYNIGGTAEEILEKNKNVKLPIPHSTWGGTIYVSAACFFQMYQSWLWAKEYPNINFVVGGSAIRFASDIVKDSPLNNLTFSGALAGDYFKCNTEPKWGITIPGVTVDPKRNFLKQYGHRHYVVLNKNVTGRCYWDKCIFCGYDYDNEDCGTVDFPIDFLKDVPRTDGMQIVHYGYPCFKPEALRRLPLLCEKADGLWLHLFIRAEKGIYRALREWLPKCGPDVGKKVFFTIGLEFPSDRMLRFIRKGITLQQWLDINHLLADYGCDTRAIVQMGWNNLQESDVGEASKFIDQMSDLTNMSIRPVTALNGGKLHSGKYFRQPFERKECHRGPFYLGYVPLLDAEQFKINKTIADMFHSRKLLRLMDTWSGGRMEGDKHILSPYWDSGMF